MYSSGYPAGFSAPAAYPAQYSAPMEYAAPQYTAPVTTYAEPTYAHHVQPTYAQPAPMVYEQPAYVQHAPVVYEQPAYVQHAPVYEQYVQPAPVVYEQPVTYVEQPVAIPTSAAPAPFETVTSQPMDGVLPARPSRPYYRMHVAKHKRGIFGHM
eukprot:NODE_11223_length_557_cov_141.188940_g10940_i0.p2 GENE.NODE_11223_length_557_cov_141.188940_g10940_i0~~NODE_11223_length_557_cov_141.188940_g10940_i0.p2  ORF type:complete len:154 (+),score=43.10 NODE_11223_length_557_cov_141.188940_g10940_i0:61-522(+)